MIFQPACGFISFWSPLPVGRRPKESRERSSSASLGCTLSLRGSLTCFFTAGVLSLTSFYKCISGVWWEGGQGLMVGSCRDLGRELKSKEVNNSIGNLLWTKCLCPPSNSYIEILTRSEMVLEDRAFERWLGHKGKVLMNEISALIKRPREHPCLFYYVMIQQEDGHLWTRNLVLTRHHTASVLTLNFPTSRTLRNKFLLFIKTQYIVFLFRGRGCCC